jgi:exportin-5
MQSMLENGPYTSARGFDSAAYSKTALPILKFDAQFNVVSAALQGYKSWMSDVSGISPEQELYMKVQKDSQDTANSLQQWCYGMVNIHTDDPIVAEQVLETLVLVVKKLKEPSSSFVLHMVQHLLTMRLYDQPAHTIFSDAVKNFEALRVVELQKIALKFSDALLEVYNELEPRIEVLVQKYSDDPRLVWGYKAFLFMIVHRAGGIDHETRMSRLQQMLRPVHASWTSPELAATVTDLQTFCASLAMGDLPDFYLTHDFHRIQDWSTHVLDAAGQARQAEIGVKAAALPLRMTKSMLAATAESLKAGSREYNDASALWSGLIPLILPNLLKMLRHAQAFHNMSNYASLSTEVQAIVKRTHQDRFWQSGISNESKDDFYARIQGSKSSFEGFASTVRGVMRTIRETGYHILYLLTKFEDKFYGLSGDLATPLAEALYADAESLSPNHLQPVINVTTGLVQRCPPHYRSQFLPVVLRHLFLALDSKISSEWDVIGQAAERAAQDGDELGDEMRSESVLRQLTFSMTHFVEWLFNFDRQQQQMALQMNGTGTNGRGNSQPSTPRPTMTELILSDPTILEPLILFCTHVLRVHDTRCCSMICRVFRGFIPVFGANPAASGLNISDETASQVREFISTEALKACITSLNEPYFADMQKELAMVIAQILSLYSGLTGTPREVLCSLPMMKPEKVDKAIAKMKGRSERGMRAVVLELLEGVRGVSIYEAGKVTVRGGAKSGSGVRSKAGTRREWQVPAQDQVGTGGEELEGVAGLFGEQ